jgi:integrase
MKQLVKLNKRSRRSGWTFTYALRYKDENGKQKCESLGHTNRRKAEKQRAQKEKELRMGYVEPCSMKLMNFLEDSLARTGDQIRESTRCETRSAMNDFIGTIGNIDFQSVTLANGEFYIQACLDRGNTKGTIAKKLRHIKRVFKLAVNRKQLDENPLQYIAMPKIAKKKINIYSDDQYQRILKAAQEYTLDRNPEKSVKWDLIIIVALATAMRRAELLNCTWADVDFDAQTIEVNPKKNAKDTWEWLIKDADRRTLPLTEEIVQMLVDRQTQQPEGYPYVFVPIARYDHIQNVLRPQGKWTLSDSRLKVVNNFKRSFDQILKRAGVKTGTFHDIRRTAISMWLVNGMSEYDVMTLAGHSSFSTTHKFYLAVADDLIHRARAATAQGLCQKLGRFGTRAILGHQEKKASSRNYLPKHDLSNGQGRI